MENKVSLLDINFKNLSLEEKREIFFMLDMMMKRLHERDLMVTDFSASQIYFQNGIYMYEKVSPISAYYSDNKEHAVLRNILGLSNLAFCSYLPDYRIQQGLLSYDVVHQQFDNFASYLPEDDRSYYKSVLVDSFSSKKLPADTVYYSDYVVKQQKTSGNSNGLSYIKATDIGRAFSQKDEAAFGHNFFFMAMVTSVTIALIGIIAYFSTYLG